ncbi:MAG: hypothetical protein ACI9K2_004231 [Myxococcota bacterium]|jgi:hypothetical protein
MTGLLLLLACGARDASVQSPAPEPAAQTGPRHVASEGLEADLAATQAFFATRPLIEQPLGTGITPVPGLPDLSARTCGTCHTELYEEWRVSVHAVAWIDPQYQGEIGKSGNRWLCLNCHTPLLVQQDLWPRGLVDDDVEQPILAPSAVFDADLRDEGITCAACHVRDGAILGPGLGGDAPHPVVVDPSFRTSAVCERCHQAEAVYPEKSFVCTFQTGDEWRAGPHDDEGTTCQECHMPVIERPAAVGGPTRTIARHWWRGAGIPKIAGRYPPLEANPPGLALEAEHDGEHLKLVLTNANAGHRLPTGDPERWVQVDVQFHDAAGTEVGSWQHRMGQTWDWSIPPKKIADNRLAPRESRTERVPVPASAVSATVAASSHRISAENAEYHHLGDYPRSVETHRLQVPLTTQP